jgi:outer membrane protein assembly factor BamB
MFLMPARHLCPIVALGLIAFTIASAMAASPQGSWPTFRGPQRTGHAPDTGLLEKWPEEGPELIWQTAGAGRGYSSLAIAEGKIYTLGDAPSTAEDQDEYLVCFEQSSGKPLWKLKTGAPWTEGKPTWQSSRSTPTVDGDRVYVVTPFGVLVCASTAGKEIWRRDLKADFEGAKADGWGYSESVLVDGNNVICTPGGPKNTIVALDKQTGEIRWTTSRDGDRGAGHASAVITNINGTKVYVQATGSGAMGVRASDGKLLWTFDIDQTTAVIPTPIVRDDLVFFVAGYGRGGALLKQVPGEDDAVNIETVYPLNPELGNKHGGVVLVGDYLYGDSEDRGIPYCAELMTGEVKWKSRGAGRESASIVAADGHIYIHYADGTMSLAKASPAEFEEVGTFKLPNSGDRPGWSHPVVLDGKLYVREGDAILCYNLRG